MAQREHGRMTHGAWRRSPRAWLAAAVMAAVVATSCAMPAGHEAGDRVHIVATGARYDAPDTLRAGLHHVVFENRDSVIHECMFIRLGDGMSVADYQAAVRAGSDFPAGAEDWSGPGLTSPGETSEQWLPLEPGRYMLGCWFNGHLTGTTPATIVVVGGPRSATPAPIADATLRMRDYRFEIVGRLTPGIRTLRVENLGPSMHEVDIYRLDDGRTIADLRAWMKAHRPGRPPAVVASGVLDAHDRAAVKWLRRDFRAGRYVFWCEMPVDQSGAPDTSATHPTHDQAGMVMELDVR